LKRFSLDHRTKIPTRPQQPPARMKPFGHRHQSGRNLLKAIRHEEKDATKRHKNTKSWRSFCDSVLLCDFLFLYSEDVFIGIVWRHRQTDLLLKSERCPMKR